MLPSLALLIACFHKCFFRTLGVMAHRGNNKGWSSPSMLITFTILLTTKVKRIKLGPAFSIASSWVRRQVQQIRGKPRGMSLCTACMCVCVCERLCVCVFMWPFSKKNEPWGTEVSRGTVAPTPWWYQRQPAIPSLPWPEQPTPESAPQVSQHATHTHPSFQAELNEFIQNDLQCMAHLFLLHVTVYPAGTSRTH